MTQWNCPEAQPEDWDNVPEITVQIIDYLAKHGKMVALHLLTLSQEETTADLRYFTEEKLNVSSIVALSMLRNMILALSPFDLKRLLSWRSTGSQTLSKRKISKHLNKKCLICGVPT